MSLNQTDIGLVRIEIKTYTGRKEPKEHVALGLLPDGEVSGVAFNMLLHILSYFLFVIKDLKPFSDGAQ